MRTVSTVSLTTRYWLQGRSCACRFPTTGGGPVVHVTLLRVGAVKRCNRSLQPGIFSESTATLGPKHTPVPTYQSSTPPPTVHRCSYKHHDVLGSFRSHVSRTNEGSGLVNMNPSLNSASRLVNMNSACTPFEHSCVYV